jgi:hypothetical protein
MRQRWASQLLATRDRLTRISQEEDRSVISDEIPVPLGGLELDTESTRITSGICRSTLSSYGRESSGNRNLATLLEQLGTTEIFKPIGTFKHPMSTCTLCVDDTFGDPFPVEMGEEIDEVEILE